MKCLVCGLIRNVPHLKYPMLAFFLLPNFADVPELSCSQVHLAAPFYMRQQPFTRSLTQGEGRGRQSPISILVFFILYITEIKQI